MAQVLYVVYSGIFGLGALLFAAMIAVFMLVYRQDRVVSWRQQRTARNDLANMMILLQTMRDLLEQQKGMARQFNTHLEKRAAELKRQLDSALLEFDRLQEVVHSLETRLEKLDSLSTMTGAPKSEDEPESITNVVTLPPSEHKRPHLHEIERPTLRVLAKPKEMPESDDRIENWVGLDFGGDVPDPLSFDVPDVTPQKPVDAESAREAFRALLNMDTTNRDDEERGKDQPAVESGNGRTRLSPLQASVYEYNDAGMSLAEIAHELGIGKGEVKLILSLRKDRDQ
ncbi:MAG: hypothetical protein WC655_26410 [Candidatus Hydrogenedentales bacterium]|jgi:hypothetical protein